MHFKSIYISYIHQNVQVQESERLWRKPMMTHKLLDAERSLVDNQNSSI